jgi:hypothetical protein
VLGLFAAVVPALLEQVLGVTSLAGVGLVVFLVFGASTVGQAAMPVLGQQRALPAGSIALIAGMALLAASILCSLLSLLICGADVAGIGHGLSFRAGLAGLNEHAPSALRAQIASGYFIVAYLGIALPAIGDGVLTEVVGLRTADVVFAAVVAVIASIGLGLLAKARHDPGPSVATRPRRALQVSGSRA